MYECLFVCIPLDQPADHSPCVCVVKCDCECSIVYVCLLYTLALCTLTICVDTVTCSVVLFRCLSGLFV